VLIISGAKGDTRRYRCFHLYEQLRLADLDCQVHLITEWNILNKVNWQDMVIFHRVIEDRLSDRIFSAISQLGGVALMDVDDFLFDETAYQWINSPDFQDPIRASLYQEEMGRFRNALQLCQGVLASTDFLAQRVKSLNIPVWVHRNAFSLEMLALSKSAFEGKSKSKDTVVIGYGSGTPTHNRDFAMIKPALVKILEKYPQTELYLVGAIEAGKDWGKLADRIKHYPLVHWRELPSMLANFDINLAPLVSDNPFAQSKSEIKYMEAGLVKVPTVASPTDAFRYAIRPNENGFLAATEEEWVAALSMLVEQEGLRVATGEQAYEDVIERYHPAVRSMELMKTLDGINQAFPGRAYQKIDAGKSTSVIAFNLQGKDMHDFSVSRQLESLPALIQRGIYSIHYRGIGTLLRQIWIQIRRWAEPLFPFT